MEWRRPTARPPTEACLHQYPSWKTIELTEYKSSLPYPYEIRTRGDGVSPLIKLPPGLYTNDASVFSFFETVVGPAIDHANAAIKGNADDDAIRSATAALRLSRHESIPSNLEGHTIIGTPEFENTLIGALYFIAAYRLKPGLRCPALAAVLKRPPYKTGTDSGR